MEDTEPKDVEKFQPSYTDDYLCLQRLFHDAQLLGHGRQRHRCHRVVPNREPANTTRAAAATAGRFGVVLRLLAKEVVPVRVDLLGLRGLQNVRCCGWGSGFDGTAAAKTHLVGKKYSRVTPSTSSSSAKRGDNETSPRDHLQTWLQPCR